MGRIIAMMGISLDGFIEGPNREIDWHRVDEPLHQHMNDVLRETGAFVSGRITYELMASYWPTADADPTEPASIREFAAIWRDAPKYVYSTTLQSADWNTTVFSEVRAADVVALANSVEGDVVVGGAVLIDEFRRLDLIDMYRVYVHPVLIGRGRPYFRDSDTFTDLELVETQVFANGVVLLLYRRIASTS